MSFLEHTDNYKGLNYFVLHHYIGGIVHHRCGYVEVPIQSIEEIDVYDDIDCHGGITYCGSGISYTDNGVMVFINEDGMAYIGFDCAHYEDLFDPKDTDFCIKECKHIIDQIVKEEK